MSLSKLRMTALKCSGAIFSYLLIHNNLLIFKLLYFSFRKVWEFISPSYIYSIVSADSYVRSHSAKQRLLEGNRVGYTTTPLVYGRNQSFAKQVIHLPDLKLYVFKDLCVNYGSDFIINSDERIVISDYCAGINDDNKGYQDAVTYYQKGNSVILRKTNVTKYISCGIMINGKFCYNYYHGLYENLIRLLILENHNDFIPCDVPILIDEDVLRIPSLFKIYTILSSKLNRETIVINNGDMVKVNQLYHITSVNYLVPVIKNHVKGNLQYYVFDKKYTILLRNQLLPYRENSVLYPKRIFISRKKCQHRSFNEDEVFAILRPLGFQQVFPEDYTFAQQLAMFNDAEWVIGGSGAALTNLLFIQPKCKVICLFRNSNYISPIFTTLVYFAEASMLYFQSSEGDTEMRAHANFKVDISQFIDFVDNYIKPNLS